MRFRWHVAFERRALVDVVFVLWSLGSEDSWNMISSHTLVSSGRAKNFLITSKDLSVSKLLASPNAEEYS